MVGRSLENRYPEHISKISNTYLEVSNWTVYHPLRANIKVVDDVNFYVKKGEIIGFAGLMGAGRTELAKSIFGKSYGSNIAGKIVKDGTEINIKNPKDAIRNGFAYVTEDRKGDGLILIDDIMHNMSIASLENISHNTVIDKNKEIQQARDYQKKLNIKSNNIFQNVESLSGGNQQKVILSRWIATEPDVLFLDEPTRGIDVGSKYEIYKIIQELSDQGKAVIVLSSELPELLGICNRIYTMNEGKLTGEFDIENANQEILMEYMTLKV